MKPPALDPVAAATYEDPYPYYTALVKEARLTYHAACDYWIAADAAAVEAVLGHDAVRVRPAGQTVPESLVGTAAGAAFASFARFTDGERHARGRAAAEASIAGLTGALAARALECASILAGEFDFAKDSRALDDYIERFPIYVLASAIGFPAPDLPSVFDGVRTFARALAPGATAAEISAGSDATRDLRETALLFQSYDATRGAIGNCLVALARHPSFLREVRRDPGTAIAIVEETLRYDSPVQNTRRYLVTDAEIAGSSIPAGDAVLVLLAAANRDARVNPDPDGFDPTRTGSRLYTFGMGSHACPGRPIAVRIAADAIRSLLAGGLDVESLIVAGYRPSHNTRIPLFSRQELR